MVVVVCQCCWLWVCDGCGSLLVLFVVGCVDGAGGLLVQLVMGCDGGGGGLLMLLVVGSNGGGDGGDDDDSNG